MTLVDKIRLKAEIKAYEKYAKLNIRRKSEEKTNVVFKFFDDIRRKTGYVK